jgi:hypothetical protein
MWWIPMILRVFVANIFFPFLLKGKIVGDKCDLPKRLVLQFFFCVVLAILFVAVMIVKKGSIVLGWHFVFLFFFGIIHAFAAYVQWKAVSISLSKNYLFTFLDDILAIILALVFLKESRFVNNFIILGSVLSISSILLFLANDYKTKKAKNAKGNITVSLAFYGYVTFYSLIWGFAIFLFRFLAVNLVPTEEFLFGWYAGAFVGSVIVFGISKIGDEAEQVKVIPKEKIMLWTDISWVGLAGLTLFVIMGLTYWSVKVAPLVIVQPIFLVCEMILPVIIGLFFFKERDRLSLIEWFYFALAIIGGTLVAVGYGSGK